MGPTRPVGGARATRTWEARLPPAGEGLGWCRGEAPDVPALRSTLPTARCTDDVSPATRRFPDDPQVDIGALGGSPYLAHPPCFTGNIAVSARVPGCPEQRRPAGARRSHAVARSHPSGWRSASRPAGEPGAERPRVPSPDAQRTSPGRVCRPSSSAPAQRTGAAPDTRRVRARVEDRPNGISRHDRSDRRLRPGRPPMVDGGGRRPSAGANACRARLRTSTTHRTAGMAARGRMVE